MNRFLRAATLLAAASTLSTLMGCANVAVTQRAVLSRPDMQLDFDGARGKIAEHCYASKEGASGGRGVGGGGCGCT